jgi:glycosyltransferase involved in cell wall biosynthesis
MRTAVLRRLRPTAITAAQESARRLALVRCGRPTQRRDLDDLVIVTELGRNNGISRGAALQRDALTRAGRSARLVDVTSSRKRMFASTAHEAGSAYVFHCGAPETALLIHRVLPQASAAWRIGYWAWELPVPPPEWRRFTHLVSELWTPSRFASDSLRAIFAGPIRVVPHQVTARPPRVREPDRPFTVLVMADSRSSFTRKNPLAAVEAFRRAFGNSSSARLILKLNGRVGEVEDLRSSVGDTGNITMIAEFLDDEALTRLLRSADVLLSLHRAEGFGLPLLEAMSHGVPVIGTDWSGNKEFMTEENSLLVPCRLVPVTDASGIYTAGMWADPDVDVAADMLRRMADDDALHARLAKAAHETVAAARPVVPA